MVIFVTVPVMQGSTTTTVKDIRHTTVKATTTITLVDGGGGVDVEQ